MITTINNDHRVFIIERLGWFVRQYFCNMEEIEKVIGDLEKNDEYKVYEFWNGKPKRVSPKKLKELLAANQLNHSFIN